MPSTAVPDLQTVVVTGRQGPIAVFMQVDAGIWSKTRQEPDFLAVMATLGLGLATQSDPSPLAPSLGVSARGMRLFDGSLNQSGLQWVAVCDIYNQPLAVFGSSSRDGIWCETIGQAEFRDTIKKLGLGDGTTGVCTLADART